MHVLPLRRDVAFAYRTSLLIALLMVVVSAGDLAWWSTGLGGLDRVRALGVTASVAGVLVPGFLAQDMLGLVVGLPILVGALWLARRGSLMGLLPWPGVLFSIAYSYTHDLVGAPFSALFLGYVAIVALGAWTAIGLVAGIDADAVRRRLGGSVRPRLVGGLLVVLALLTAGQDGGGAVASALASGEAVDPHGRAVWIADLALVVPAMLVVGALLWRGSSVGYVAAAGLLLSFGLASVAIAAMMLLQPVLTGAAIDGATVMGLLVFGAVALAPLILFARAAAGGGLAVEPWVSRVTTAEARS
jgi:hypothetical protein